MNNKERHEVAIRDYRAMGGEKLNPTPSEMAQLKERYIRCSMVISAAKRVADLGGGRVCFINAGDSSGSTADPDELKYIGWETAMRNEL